MALPNNALKVDREAWWAASGRGTGIVAARSTRWLDSTEMRPGQIQPNELESAILNEMAPENPKITSSLAGLHVLSRTFTGVGSFTEFKCPLNHAQRQIGLDRLVRVPGVEAGLAAVLFVKGDCPAMLEIYTFGDTYWDGTYGGFAIEGAV